MHPHTKPSASATATGSLAHLNMGDRKRHAQRIAREQAAQEAAKTTATIEQARRLKIENAERIMTLIERARANGIDPTILKAQLLR